MLTCITRAKQGADESAAVDRHHSAEKTSPNAIKSLSSQLKDMALKASGAYRHCAPFPNQPELMASDKFRRSGSSRLKGISSGEGTQVSASGRRVEPIVFVEEKEAKEWVAQVEAGVLITFVSLPAGGNDLKRIRFSREKFNKWQAQSWWADNCEKLMELYNVKRVNQQVLPIENSLPPSTGMGMSYSSSDSQSNCDSCGFSSSTKTETSSLRTSPSRDADELSISNASDLENEWVEQDEPGVYITIRVLPDGTRELKRVRFSREKFSEIHARLWWEENRARIHKQHL